MPFEYKFADISAIDLPRINSTNIIYLILILHLKKERLLLLLMCKTGNTYGVAVFRKVQLNILINILIKYVYIPLCLERMEIYLQVQGGFLLGKGTNIALYLAKEIVNEKQRKEKMAEKERDRMLIRGG